MCRIRTLIVDDKGEVQKDTIIDVRGLTLNVIDIPAFCVCARKNVNGFENIIFKYPNSTEEMQTFISASSLTLMTVGRISGCIYAYQYKSETGLSEMTEMKKKVLQKSTNARYRKNIEQQLRLLECLSKKVVH